MAKRLCLLIFAAWTLASTAPATGQCRTEIIVYLDISGSTRPTDRNPATSPFAATVEALDALLAANDLVGAEDVVNVRLFGESVRGGGRYRAQGPRALQRLVAELRENTLRDSLTDLVAVLKDLDEELADDSTFARRLVIFASDFVHETDGSVNRESFLDDWQQRVAELEDSVLGRLAGSETTVLQFFVLPPWQPRSRPTGYFRPLQRSVLDTLDPDGRRRTSLASLSPEDLAREIRAALLYPPAIEGLVISEGGRPRLRVEVKNINCQPVRLAALGAHCPRTGGDPVPIGLGGGAASLEPRGGRDNIETTVSLEDLGCVVGDRIEIAARFEGGEPEIKQVDAANKVFARPSQSIFESITRKGWLHLYVDFRGQKVSGSTHELRLGNDGEVFRGRFELPNSLTESFQTYRFVIGLDVGDISHVRSALAIDVSGVEMDGDDREVEIIRSRFDDYMNRVFLILGGALLLASLFSPLTDRQREVLSVAERLVNWGGLALVSAGVLVFDYVRASAFASRWDDWVRWLALAALIGFFLFLWLRQRHLVKLDKRIEELYRLQRAQENDDDKDQGDMAAVAAAVARVKAIVEMAGQKLRIVGISVGVAVALAVVAWLAVHLLRPESATERPSVRETISITRIWEN